MIARSGESRQARLVEKLGMDKHTVIRYLRELERYCYIEKRNDPEQSKERLPDDVKSRNWMITCLGLQEVLSSSIEQTEVEMIVSNNKHVLPHIFSRIDFWRKNKDVLRVLLITLQLLSLHDSSSLMRLPIRGSNPEMISRILDSTSAESLLSLLTQFKEDTSQFVDDEEKMKQKLKDLHNSASRGFRLNLNKVLAEQLTNRTLSVLLQIPAARKYIMSDAETASYILDAGLTKKDNSV